MIYNILESSVFRYVYQVYQFIIYKQYMNKLLISKKIIKK
jgi:hypothetical protein